MATIIKRTYWALLQDGKRVKRKCRHYTIQFRDAAGKLRRVRGYTDKAATQQRAAELEKAQARGEQGLVNPFAVHLATPLAQHMADYIADLRTTGRDNTYTGNAEKRLQLLAKECSWATLADVTPASFMRWREIEYAGGTKRKCRGTKPPSATTLNQYLDTAKAFLNWCASSARIGGIVANGGRKKISDLLAGVTKAVGERVRKRRALSDDEVARLLTAASGDRQFVYRLALASGLRRGELRDLKWGDLQLQATAPYIQLRAEATKAKRGDRVYLPTTLAAELRKRRAKWLDGDKVLPGVPDMDLWREDLANAKIPYKDGLGRQVDFHGGTRKTLCTRMHRNNVSLAVAMRVMRHTDAKLTMVDYVDDDELGLAASVLPEIVAAETESQKSTA